MEYKGYFVTVTETGFATPTRASATFSIRKGKQTGEISFEGIVQGQFASSDDIEKEALAKARGWIEAHPIT